MTQITLTEEQLAVIHHPLGQHARVLAVAGSGKSFTMACRIQHLVQDCNIPPHAIQVLMFNRLARQQFRSHLDRTGPPDVLQPERSILSIASATTSFVKCCELVCCLG